jgi:hypothetical protein
MSRKIHGFLNRYALEALLVRLLIMVRHLSFYQ